jgi:hypothetical protein
MGDGKRLLADLLPPLQAVEQGLRIRAKPQLNSAKKDMLGWDLP